MNCRIENFAVEPERCEFSALPIHQFAVERRDFLKLLGAGLVVFAVAKRAPTQEISPDPKGFHAEELPNQIAAWLHIGRDGKVTGFVGKAEVGQNIRTSLSQTIADELRVSPEEVRLIMADTALSPFDAGTFGSRTTLTMTPQFRKAAAAARDILVAKAAKQWNLSPEELVAENGKVMERGGRRSLTYGELAHDDLFAQQLRDTDPVKPATEWVIAGKPLPKVDARAFVTGEHQYSIDLHPQGMLFGKILRPPSFGATVTSYDDALANAMTDVILVRDGDFIGAAARTAARAQEALDALKVQWKEVPQVSDKEIFSYLKKSARASTNDRFRQTKGSVSDGLSSATHKLSATYNVAYIAHAPLEPRAAVAQWTNGKLTVWMGTQRPFAVRYELASVFHMSNKDVRVIVPDTGSAYGGKHTSDAGLEAARLARAANGRPVKVAWTRPEEFTWAYFRSAGVIEVKSGVSADGKLTAWECHNYNSGISAIQSPYAVANEYTEFHEAPPVLRTGSYRGLAATANHFAREIHMDELAAAAQMDTLEFRLKNLTDRRLSAVLEAAAKAFGWPRQKTSQHQGFGIAAGFEKGGYVATCAEVSVDRTVAIVQIVKLVEAFECGAIVNPDGLKNQVVGAMIQGLGGALFESIQFEKGRILNDRFSSYRVPRFRDVPQIEVVLVDRKDIPSAGAGETPIMTVAPAIASAFYDATGVRLRDLPLSPERHLSG